MLDSWRYGWIKLSKLVATEVKGFKRGLVMNVTDLILSLTYSEIGRHQMTLCPIKNLLTANKVGGAHVSGRSRLC